LRRKLGAAARERALQAFDIAGHVENVESVYRSVLANGKGRGGESGGAAG
jgi:hypothetical protein